jgi:tetratricopeptide (TPR) repeat protein
MALVNDYWNRGWNAFTRKRFEEALTWQERTARHAEKQPGMLPEVLYDLAVIRLANGKKDEALAALRRAIELNPKLLDSARKDDDLAPLHRHLD